MVAAGCAADSSAPDLETAATDDLAVVTPSLAVPAGAVRDADGRVHYSIQLRRSALPAVASNAAQDTRFAAYHPATAKQLVRTMERDHGLSATDMQSAVALAFSAYLTPAQLAEVRADPRVDKIVVDEYGGELSAIWVDSQSAGETIPWGTQAVNNAGGTGTYPVYVLDTGFTGHQDLNVTQSVNPSNTLGHVLGCFAHGTAVAGTIGAKSNGLGARGVAPGTPITSVSVLADGNYSAGCLNTGTTYNTWMAALDFVKAQLIATNRVGIINISSNRGSNGANTPTDNLFGPGGTVNPLIQAIATPSGTYKGALVVESAGNHFADACTWSYIPPGGVALANDGVIVVGGLNQSDQPVTDLTVASGSTVVGFHNLPTIAASESGSDFGACVDMWAPGEQIFTTWSTNAAAFGSAFTTISGTSLSAPHVTGLAAMIMSSANPPTTSIALEAAVRAKMVTLGSNDHGTAIRMPTLSGVPNPASGPYTEIYETADRVAGGTDTPRIPQATASPLTSLALYNDAHFSLFFGTQAAGTGCTFNRVNLGLGTTVALASTSGANGFATAATQTGWASGVWAVRSPQCPMPDSVISIAPHGVVRWTQPSQTVVSFGEISPSATPQCTVDAFSTANPSIHVAGFPVTEAASSHAYVLPTASGAYTYTASCNDLGPGPQKATGQINVIVAAPSCTQDAQCPAATPFCNASQCEATRCTQSYGSFNLPVGGTTLFSWFGGGPGGTRVVLLGTRNGVPDETGQTVLPLSGSATIGNPGGQPGSYLRHISLRNASDAEVCRSTDATITLQ